MGHDVARGPRRARDPRDDDDEGIGSRLLNETFRWVTTRYFSFLYSLMILCGSRRTAQHVDLMEFKHQNFQQCLHEQAVKLRTVVASAVRVAGEIASKLTSHHACPAGPDGGCCTSSPSSASRLKLVMYVVRSRLPPHMTELTA